MKFSSTNTIVFLFFNLTMFACGGIGQEWLNNAYEVETNAEASNDVEVQSAPTIVSVTVPAELYSATITNPSEEIPIYINFSEDIVIEGDGAISLKINSGSNTKAYDIGLLNPDQLELSYTTQSGHSTAGNFLEYSENALSAGDAKKITSASSGLEADLTLPSIDGGNSLSAAEIIIAVP